MIRLVSQAAVLAIFAFSAYAAPVIGPGHEALFLAMGDLPPEAKVEALEGINIERDAVTFAFVVGGRTVRIRLVHPDMAPGTSAKTAKFALVLEDEVPAALVRAFQTRVQALESRFEWAEETSARPTTKVFTPALPEDATPFNLLPANVPALPARVVSDFQEARDFLSKGQNKEAARKARAMVRSYPNDLAVLRAAASILRASGRGKESLATMKKAASLSNSAQVIEMAASLLAAGRSKEAKAFLAGDSSAPQEAPECRLVAVLTLLAQEGRLDLARTYAPSASSGERCVFVFRLKLAHALGDDALVDSAAEAGLKAFPDDESLLYLWGYHYFAKQAMDRAISVWDRLVARNLRFPAVLGQYGTAYLVAGRLDRNGVNHMLERVQKDPNDLVASFLAGLGLYYLKAYERVVPLLEPVVKAVPNESRARLYLAMAHHFLGHQETAERMFEEMEPFAYHDPDIYYCRSLIYRKRDLARAIREMERFLEVFVGERRLSFGPEKIEKARSDLERMRRGEVPEVNLPGEPLVPAR